jgi:phosphatidate phosphatase APP1
MLVWNKILHWLGMEGRTHIRVYRGFGGAEQLEIFGQVLSWGPLPATKYRRFALFNMLALLRLFLVKPRAGATVKLVWEGVTVEGVTEKDGFFHLQWKPVVMPAAGTYHIEVSITNVESSPVTTGKGVVFIPQRSRFGLISDIDDTFLVSHSATVLKRLYLLFTRNSHTRKPFEGVANHYRLLSGTGNPFFYVSSSEWNLYDFIREFSRYHKLPQGIYLLSQIKQLHQLLKTGQQKHATKFTRISRILKHYPHMRFVLLGDDTQEDPNIYKALTEHFSSQIIAVYLRHVRESRYEVTKQLIAEIEAKGIPACYFKHSEEAIAHSRANGLITD